MVTAKQVAAGLAFASTTSVQPFLTKIVVNTYRFDFPFALLALRFSAGLVAVEALRLFGCVRVRPISLGRSKALLVASACNAVCMVCTVVAMRGMNVPMFTAVRQCTPLATLVLTVVVLGKPRPPPLNVLAVLLITAGCAFAGMGDMSFDVLAYVTCIVSVVTLAMYTLLIQQASEKFLSMAEVFQINCYNTVPLVLLGSYINGELVQAWQKLLLMDAWFFVAFCATIISGNLLTYSMFICTHLNSAMTTSIIGVLKTVPQVLVGLFTFGGVPLNVFNISGLSLNMLGGILFTVAKQREHIHHKTS